MIIIIIRLVNVILPKSTRFTARREIYYLNLLTKKLKFIISKFEINKMSFLEKLKNISNDTNKKYFDDLECYIKEKCEFAARKQYKSVRILYKYPLKACDSSKFVLLVRELSYTPKDFKIIADKLELQIQCGRISCDPHCATKIGRFCNYYKMPSGPMSGGADFYGW